MSDSDDEYGDEEFDSYGDDFDEFDDDDGSEEDEDSKAVCYCVSLGAVTPCVVCEVVAACVPL